jgi:hypothetical protein
MTIFVGGAAAFGRRVCVQLGRLEIQPVASNEQRATGNEQRVTSNE